MRDTKDGLVVPQCGAEAVPFLKIFAVLPIAILYMVVYSMLSNKMNKETLFYTALSPFIVFFALFPTVIYPNREFLELNTLAEFMRGVLPQGFYGFILAIEHWHFATFYVMAELWGSVAISLLFWGFANEITKTSEAKRFYTIFGMGANVALIFSGWFVIWANSRGQFQDSLNYMMSIIIALSVMTIATYYWMNRRILTDSRFYNASESCAAKKGKKSKPKLGLFESFGFLSKSTAICCIAVLVLSYGIGINLVEVTWKSQVKLQYPDSQSYTRFMGGFSTVAGCVTMPMYFIGGYIIRRFGWMTAAMFTPIMLFITGLLFFTFMIFSESSAPLAEMMGTTPLMLAVIFGAMQNIVSKATKYSLFDPTKEMAYIPLDQESKVKGKAAIDVVGARLGKSSGALINMLLIITFGSIAAVTSYLLVMLTVVLLAWMASVKTLGGILTTMPSEDNSQDTEDKKSVGVSEEKAVPAS